MARRRPSEPTPSVARGAALVVVAVLVGLFLLRNGVDTEVTRTADRTPNGAETTDDTAADDGTDEAAETDGTDTTEPQVRPPAQVTVVVLNAGSGVTGAAGRFTTALSDAGYQTVDAGNSTTPVTATQVLYAEGYEAEAQALLELLGATGTTGALAEPPGEIGAANLVVLLGPDIAGNDPPLASTAGPGAGTDGGAEGEGDTTDG